MSTDAPDPRSYEFLSSSPVTVFHRTTLLQQTVTGLSQAGFRIVSLGANNWHTEQEMHADLARALDFPAYYGNNFDAFHDCLGDVMAHHYGFPEDATGLVVVMSGFDQFAAELPAVAHQLLDIIASRSRLALADGQQLLCLIQSAAPSFSMPPVGGTEVLWNPVEAYKPVDSFVTDPSPSPETPKQPWWRRRP
ncbi:barstar family protein [Actinoplanes subglobosus]|uniref:Barstar family protein n=1 Tax=Actinoplanes subglobosus TaxID=1547892 RepID=A0ABV8J0A9_9ACTN